MAREADPIPAVSLGFLPSKKPRTKPANKVKYSRSRANDDGFHDPKKNDQKESLAGISGKEIDEKKESVEEVIDRAQEKILVPKQNLPEQGSLVVPKKMGLKSSIPDFELLIEKVGAVRAGQFLRVAKLAGENLEISISLAEIGRHLGLKKQATGNLLEVLMKAGLLSIVAEFNGKTQTPRIYKVEGVHQ